MAGERWEQAIRSLAVPVLFIHGDHDAIPEGAARASAAMMPRARALIIRGADHLPWIDEPAQFFAAADQFLMGEWPDRSEAVP